MKDNSSPVNKEKTGEEIKLEVLIDQPQVDQTQKKESASTSSLDERRKGSKKKGKSKGHHALILHP